MSLQDIIFQRAALQHQNMLNSDNVGIALSSLAQGVSQGIQQGQEQMQKEKDEERKFKRQQEQQDIIQRQAEKFENNALASGRKITRTFDTKTGATKITSAEQSLSDKFLSGQLGSLGMGEFDADFQFDGGVPPVSGFPSIRTQSGNFHAEGLNIGGIRYKNFEAEAQSKALAAKIAAQSKKSESIKGAQLQTLNNIENIAGVANELSSVYADAVREGGMGDIVSDTKFKAASFLGGNLAENFPRTAAYEGAVTEIVSRMMPLLTQQGDSPGSVRLVESIFRKLEKTLPAGKTPPKNARSMMQQTLTNMYRFARAAQNMGITNESVDRMSDVELGALSEQIERMSKSINLQGEERQMFDLFLNTALEPIDRLIGERELKKSTVGRFTVEVE